MDEKGYLLTRGKSSKTNIPGVFAAAMCRILSIARLFPRLVQAVWLPLMPSIIWKNWNLNIIKQAVFRNSEHPISGLQPGGLTIEPLQPFRSRSKISFSVGKRNSFRLEKIRVSSATTSKTPPPDLINCDLIRILFR